MPWKPKQHRPHGVERRRTPDNRRLNARQRGYDTAWEKVRALKRAMNPLCEMCEQHGRAVPLDEVDHIIPIEIAPELRLDINNLQSLCKSHHRRKTLADQRKYGKK